MEGADWPLVGRGTACSAIVSAMGGDPVRNVVIAGPAGVGRTRLAREAVAVAAKHGRSSRWAAGTAATALVPLGALAHLIPAVDVASDPLALLQRATAAIVRNRTEPRPALAIDDVHLLDPLSITLLHQLAASGAVPMILTVRTGGGAKDPVAALWKDGRAVRFDLQPLSRADTETLLTELLGGELESRAAERLWQLTLGNPLFLREVVEDGRRSGRLRRERKLWRWEGHMIPSQRLVDIVQGHLGDLDASERRALEVLAAAEPVSVHQLVALSSSEAVASLERRGVISDQTAAGAGMLRVAHPVYSAVIRSQVSGAPIRLVQDQLGDIGADLGRGPKDLLRRSAVMVESDVRMRDAGVLVDGANRALTVPDVALAERLGRAAVEAGGGVAAYLPLIEATRWSVEPEQAESLAVQAASQAVTDVDIARLAAARALNLFCALGRPQQAVAAVRDAAAVVKSRESRGLVAATESMLAVLGGEPRAQRLSVDALSATRPGDPAQPLAAAAATWSLTLAGRTGQALAAADAGWAALQSTSPVSEGLLSRAVLAQAEVLALYLAGRLKELDRRTEERLQENLAMPEWAGDAIVATHRGWAALAAGHPGRAARWLEEALSGLERRDPLGMRGFCASLLVTAYAVAGDVGRVREVMEGQRFHPRGVLPVFRPVAGLAWAWRAHVEGRVADAGDLVLEAAALAAEQGQPGVQALLLHRAVHFSRAGEVADWLRDLAAHLDSALVGDLAAHAQAAASRDGSQLEEASRRLEETGALMFAADCAAAAAAAFQRTGARRSAAKWTTRARALGQQCGLAHRQRAAGLAQTGLTLRELEVAQLASQGLSNRAIADRLHLSGRTVETHLSHVYTKLGITGRARLGAFLPEPRSGPPAADRAAERAAAGLSLLFNP